LRSDIVAGAASVLEETGSEDAVTLRAVARRIGIAAPSIYGHFPNRDTMVLAVIAEAFEELDAALVTAATSAAQADHLRVVCRAYLQFAASRPHRYRVMFARHRGGDTGTTNEPRLADELLGATAFGRLVEAVAHHQGEPSASPLQPAIALWVALHGYVSLRSAVPAFPWPPEDTMLDDLITRNVAASTR
jgi:AcrR family transcriptional regulator